MAIYRYIQTSFWQDGFVLDLTPEEKFFYIYLMTNQKTTQCGIYELPIKVMETETGYSKETLEKLLNRFVDYKKILYCKETREIMVINWMKFNFVENKNSIICINRELKSVKQPKFLEHLFEICQELKYPINELFKGIYSFEAPTKPLDSPLQAPTKTLGSKEQEQDKEQDKEQQQQQDKRKEGLGSSSGCLEIREIIRHFEKCNFRLSPINIEEIETDIEIYGPQWVVEAATESDKRGKHSYVYYKGILENWQANGQATKRKTDNTGPVPFDFED